MVSLSYFIQKRQREFGNGVDECIPLTAEELINFTSFSLLVLVEKLAIQRKGILEN